MILKIVLNFLIVFLLSIPTVASESTLLLKFEDLKRRLEENSEVLKAANLQTEAAEVRNAGLARSFLPSLSVYGGQETFKTGRQAQLNQPAYGAELQMNIFNGGRDSIDSEIGELNKNIKSMEYQRSLAQELENLRIAFWKILYVKEHIKLIEEALKINKTNLQAAIRRLQSGVGTSSDRIEFEMHEVDLTRDLKESQLQFKTLQTEISMILNLEAGQSFVFSESLAHEHDYESIVAHSPKDHEFLFKGLEFESQTHELAAQKQRRGFWPQVDAYASYDQFNQREIDQVDEGERTESKVGIKLTLNLLSGFTAGREAMALIKESAATRKLAQLKRKEVEAHLHSEISELKLLHDQVHDAEANIIRAKRYYELSASEYRRGVKSSPEMLGASMKLFETQKKYYEIVRDFQISKAHVLASVGK